MAIEKINTRTGGIPPEGAPKPVTSPPTRGASQSFLEALEAAGISVSKHAQSRLSASPLDGAQAQRVETALDKAAGRNLREVGVLLDDLTFIVSVRNRAIISAVSDERSKDGVFTNVDGFVKA